MKRKEKNKEEIKNKYKEKNVKKGVNFFFFKCRILVRQIAPSLQKYNVVVHQFCTQRHLRCDRKTLGGCCR